MSAQTSAKLSPDLRAGYAEVSDSTNALVLFRLGGHSETINANEMRRWWFDPHSARAAAFIKP
ncbi:MAG TPA: hypothetical protein VF961_04445, partial [Pyrinomonadaceae bacterium]